MKFLQRIKGCIKDLYVREELNTYSMNYKIIQNKEEWKSNFDRINNKL